MMINRIQSRLRQLEQAAADNEDRECSGVKIYLPDNGRGDEQQTTVALDRRIVIYKPKPSGKAEI